LVNEFRGEKVSDVSVLLGELGELLGRYGLGHHAAYVEGLAATYGENRERFAEEIANPLMWGGAGSVVDMGPRSGNYEDEGQAWRDQSRFRRLIIALVDDLVQEGLATDDAVSVATAFRRLESATE
jgi:hypothetical protein